MYSVLSAWTRQGFLSITRFNRPSPCSGWERVHVCHRAAVCDRYRVRHVTRSETPKTCENAGILAVFQPLAEDGLRGVIARGQWVSKDALSQIAIHETFLISLHRLDKKRLPPQRHRYIQSIVR